MTKNLYCIIALTAAALLFGSGRARAADAADFPPGQFTDGGRYSLSQLQGKVVVLFFFEETCPRCRGLIPERNKLMTSLHDKPVLFIAVDPGHTLTDSKLYAQETKLAMPIFSDPLRLMEARWKEHISLQNIYQFKIIGADGKVAGLSEEEIAKIAGAAKWRFKGNGYDSKLDGAIDAFEWNQYALGMSRLRPYLKSKDAALLADALKLYAEIKTDGESWKADADKAVEEDPVAAYDLYAKVADVFGKDELGKSVADPLKKLKTNAAVKQEMAARKMFDQLSVAISGMTEDKKAQVAQGCKLINTKYPQTPTGKRAADLAAEIG